MEKCTFGFDRLFDVLGCRDIESVCPMKEGEESSCLFDVQCMGVTCWIFQQLEEIVEDNSSQATGSQQRRSEHNLPERWPGIEIFHIKCSYQYRGWNRCDRDHLPQG